LLDIERGFWARNELDLGTSPADPLSARTAKVIPYVEDRRNCLLFIPEMSLDGAAMASLQAALKTAIQITFQLEDSELAAEPLPNRDNRRHLLLYEAAEGGAGVLRRLIDDSSAMAQVATEALRLCHFDPLTGADERKAPGASEECEAGCYDCLMSYANQRDHQLLDRQKVREFLMSLTGAQVVSSSRPTTRADHRDHLLRLTDSELERRWLRFLDEAGYRLPTDAQVAIRECQTRPDFLYQSEGNQAVIYIDGPPHDYPDRQNRDAAQEELLEDKGWLVIRFHHEEDWVKKLATYPSVFGRPS
jgi:very-short-patch-repair endonuclease